MRLIEREWQWRFAAPPEALWPVLADTARFNEAMGLPRYTVNERPRPDGSVERVGTARVFGVPVAWQEGVPEWVAPRLFRHERRLLSGPLDRVATVITIDPAASGGSDVRYRLAIELRSNAFALALRLAPLNRFGRNLDRLFRAAAEAARGDPAEFANAFGTPPPALPKTVRERIEARANAVAAQGYGAVRRLSRHLIEAPDSDVERMRPRTLARQWGLPPREVIEAFLAAAREGLLTLRWDLICPRCRGAKAVVKGLDQLPQGAHCPSCNIPFDRDFSRNVEVTFDPADDIRPPADGTFCLASPIAAGHVKVQQRLGPRGAIDVAVSLEDGEYRARTVEPGGASDFCVADQAVPEIVLGDGNAAVGPAAHRDWLHARNGDEVERTLVVEDRGWAGDALTAHEVTTMQAFRDLFADAVLRPGDEVEIRRVALMFTDVRGSTELYNRVGDAQAYGWVREHFAVLTAAVRAHDGALVKTIGDAVMAAFSDPLNALAAALAIREGIAAFNSRLRPTGGAADTALVVRLGLHCGSCIAVTLNDRLDYFGATVNLAARLEHESRGGDIVLSQAIAAEPGMAAQLAALPTTAETVSVRGFAEPVGLLRIAAVA